MKDKVDVRDFLEAFTTMIAHAVMERARDYCYSQKITLRKFAETSFVTAMDRAQGKGKK